MGGSPVDAGLSMWMPQAGRSQGSRSCAGLVPAGSSYFDEAGVC